MPDWFYRPVARPLLSRLPAATARGFALAVMGRLARLPLGPHVIAVLGHMRPDRRLAVRKLGTDFPSSVGLGPDLDPRAVAIPAFARFGVGFLDVGPVSPDGGGSAAVGRDDGRQAIAFPDRGSLPLADARPKLAEAAATGVPLVVRLAGGSAGDVRRVAAEVGPFAAVIAVADHWAEAADGCGKPVLVVIPADLPADKAFDRVDAGRAAGAAGVLVDGAVAGPGGERVVGEPAREPAVRQVAAVRERWPGAVVLAGGGAHEPADVVALLAAGADLVEVDSGLVFTGPGLVKRANDAVLSRHPGPTPPAADRAAERSWFWLALMGGGMLFGGALAAAVAATRVVLPYDEAFVGLTRDGLAAVNPRLLGFLAHDRVTLAGTMAALGILYVGLSADGVRHGHHWAQVAVQWSAFAGFASFFLFLGYGYLDPFHAFVSAVLFQLLLLGVYAPLGPPHPEPPEPPRTDRAWRLGRWGQLILVVHAAAGVAAGLTIAAIGVTAVFVGTDLEYMGTTADQLCGANPRLVPLVAHDRATFGGMLVCTSLTFLLCALWGPRSGRAWLWRTVTAAGLAGYVPAIAVHYAVGYTDPWHLLPAFAGLAAFLLGCGLSYPELCRPTTGDLADG